MPHQGIHAWEREALGADHAREHAEIRRMTRAAAQQWAAMSPAQRGGARARNAQAERAARRASVSYVRPKDRVGAWTRAPFALPNYAIHAAMLPTGKVLLWGYPPSGGAVDRPNFGEAAVWDPSKGTGPDAFDNVAPPQLDVNGDGITEPAPVYCSGESFLPNGDVLIAGGNLAFPRGSAHGQVYTNYAGLPNVFTFDPWTESWSEQPSLEAGRWYPTQVELADGSTAILGGYTHEAPGAIFNQTLDTFRAPDDPAGQGEVSSVGAAPYGQTLYPRLNLLPDGRVIMSGPTPSDTAILDPNTFDWSNYPNFSDARTGGNAIHEPGSFQGSWKVTLIGGYGWEPDDHGARRSTETTNAMSAHPTWRRGPALHKQRAWQNTVILPDRSKVAVGGGIGFSPDAGNYTVSAHSAQRHVEVFDPARHRWLMGPPEVEDRTYHSVALLLPDGRVWSAGDDMHPLQPDGGASQTDTAEIYSPPYLFRGSRPRITSAPATLGYLQGTRIATDGPAPKSAVLISPAAVTHAVDMGQRYVRLKVVDRTRHDIAAVAPPRPAVAPPGYYMLFVLDAKGVPSKASWVQLR